jgi:AcrR family transcriptional regulator
LGQIAKQLGFRPRTIARRYPTKEALGLAVLEWQVGQALKAFPKDSSAEPTRVRLEHALDGFIRCYLDHNGLVARLAADLWKACSKDRDARLRLSWVHAQWQTLVQEILETGIREREVRPIPDPSAAATALVAACEGMALRVGILGEAIVAEAFRASLVELLMSSEARSAPLA